MQVKVLYGEEEILCEASVHEESKLKLEVLPDGHVLMRVPSDFSEAEMKAFLLRKARWVLTQQQELFEQRQHVRERQYISGESFFYLGRRYVLKVRAGEENSVKLLRGSLNVSVSESQSVKSLIDLWYKDHAKKYFLKRLSVLSEQVPWVKTCPEMKLFLMQKQWGSCSPNGVIVLNPHLVKAPRECIDYVIIHELCHLQEHNHSPRFYSLLEQCLPHWKATKQKLDSMAELYLNE